MAPQRGTEKLLRIRITNASVDFRLHVRITNDHWMQISLAEPFISQAPVDECLQQISRILCPAPERGALSCEEPLRQLFHAFVFLEVIFQFVLIRLIPEMPSTLSRPYPKHP